MSEFRSPGEFTRIKGKGGSFGKLPHLSGTEVHGAVDAEKTLAFLREVTTAKEAGQIPHRRRTRAIDVPASPKDRVSHKAIRRRGSW